MDKKLHLLETLRLRGDDGKTYVVHGYEHLARLEGMPDTPDQWQPTGLAEYKLATGEPVRVDRATGEMSVPSTGVMLERAGAIQTP